MKRILAVFIACLAFLGAQGAAEAQVAESSDTAKVIFYRSSDDGGKPYSLTSQNETLAKLKKGEKFEQTLAPGVYYYMADPSTKQVFKLEVAAGQTIYVEAGRNDDYFKGQPTLQITNAQSYQQALANAD